MYSILIDKECGCFRKSNLTNNIKISSKDDALVFAIQTKDKMNNKFCGKHKFILSEIENNFVISMNNKSNCCGNGHC